MIPIFVVYDCYILASLEITPRMAPFYFGILCESGKAQSNNLTARKQAENETVKHINKTNPYC
jgi:hypothetical protein